MMSFPVTVYLALIAVGYWPQLGTALGLGPNHQVGAGLHSCPSPGLEQLYSNILSILVGLMNIPQCGDGLWYQVTYLNMTNSTHECPSNWKEISTPVRTCGRSTSTRASCSSGYFSTRSLQYSKVCGRAIGYQDGDPGAFSTFRRAPAKSSNDNYVDGLSVTHGMPRVHIWTYAAGVSDANLFNDSANCPCANPATTTTFPPPSFIGDNYFCESGNQNKQLGSISGFFEDDPIWDGEQCEGECCSNGKSPPWFSVTLPDPTSDDIEVRICGDEGTQDEDTPVQLLEIFIQ